MRTIAISSLLALLAVTAGSTASAQGAHRRHSTAHATRAKIVHRASAQEPVESAPEKQSTKESKESKETHRIGSKEMRGIYVRGSTAGKPTFGPMLDKMVARGMNAVVLDSKDYDGILTYPSKVALANEAHAVPKEPPIENLAATIREIHARGIKVIMRVSCFNDELMSHARPKMSVQSKAGRPYRLGWLDPSNPDAQKYIKDLAREAIDAGADEVELDYVRYPVTGIHNADFHLEERGLTQIKVISSFVKDVHAITHSRGVPLSLDIFGVVAFGKREDIERLGQEPTILASECEVLSPMVYPSHYTSGYFGFDVPGDHPELVGYATKSLKAQIANVPHAAQIRPWLQAARWESPTFNAAYVAKEIHSSDGAGGDGWLMWNPGQKYGVVWAATETDRHR
jgi:hypothetical protein